MQGALRIRKKVQEKIFRQEFSGLLSSQLHYAQLSQENVPQGRNTEAHVSLHRYEPEYIKYGGQAGMVIAEKLFEASSEFAVKTISLEKQKKIDRTLVALYTTRLAVEMICADKQSQDRFLSHYLWHSRG